MACRVERFMAHFRLSPYRSIEELDKKVRATRAQENVVRLRRQVRIAVIDDKDFSPLENLRKNEFDVTPFKDVPSMETLSGFHIIMVDIQGVGTALNPTQQGGIIRLTYQAV